MKTRHVDQLESLYAEHRNGLYAYALSHLHCRAQAEDAVHDAFAKLLKKPRQMTNLKAYAYRTVRNAAIDLLRRHTATAPSAHVDLIDWHAAQHNDDRRETARVLQSALKELSADQREVIQLHLNAGLGFRVISDILEKPQGTVVSWYRRGIEDLRQHIKVDYDRHGRAIAEPAGEPALNGA